MPDAGLRPLSFGEILDQSVTLFRRLFVPLVTVQLVCVGPVYPFQLYLIAAGRQISVAYYLFALVSFVLSALASAAVALIISENYLGRELAAMPAIRLALPRVGPVIVLSFALGLVLMLAAMPAFLAMGAGAMFLVPGNALVQTNVAMGAIIELVGFALLLVPLAVFSGLAVATPALILENIQAGKALSRSWSLTRGSRLRVLGMLFITGLLIAIPFFGIGLLAGIFRGGEMAAGPSVTFAVLSYGVSLALTPLFYCVLTLLYYDLRVRKEGFDLEMLAATLAP